MMSTQLCNNFKESSTIEGNTRQLKKRPCETTIHTKERSTKTSTTKIKIQISEITWKSNRQVGNELPQTSA